jgi:hypothetical protein
MWAGLYVSNNTSYTYVTIAELRTINVFILNILFFFYSSITSDVLMAHYKICFSIKFIEDLNLVYQYSKTNEVHFLLNLLSIQGLYMFRALLAHPQDSLHKRHLIY